MARAQMPAVRAALTLLGLALLIFWGYWWISSVRLGKLRHGDSTWIPTLDRLGVDFAANYYAARDLGEGRNPYDHVSTPIPTRYDYAPPVIWLFSWCRWLDWRPALLVWLAVSALLAGLGGLSSWQARRSLGIHELPFLWMTATILCSTPVIFAMERGNCDLLVLLLMIATLSALDGSTIWREILAAICLALAFYVKPYAGLLWPGLLAVRRPRVFLYWILAALTIAAVDIKSTFQFVHNLSIDLRVYDIEFHWSAHPFSTYWPHLWAGTRFAFLNMIPGTLAAIMTLLPLTLWVSYRVFQSPNQSSLRYPYFCWLTAVATCVPLISNDYNFFFLPLAALAVWDRRDHLIVHVLMLPLLVWWQPLQLPHISHKLLFFFKLSGLLAAGLSLAKRAGEQAMTQETQKFNFDVMSVAEAA